MLLTVFFLKVQGPPSRHFEEVRSRCSTSPRQRLFKNIPLQNLYIVSWEKMTISNLPEDYRERLDAVVNNRFEISDKINAIERESLASNDGKPKPSVRYNYTWWTPEGERKRSVFHMTTGTRAPFVGIIHW